MTCPSTKSDSAHNSCISILVSTITCSIFSTCSFSIAGFVILLSFSFINLSVLLHFQLTYQQQKHCQHRIKKYLLNQTDGNNAWLDIEM